MLSTLADSGLEIAEAERITLIYDGKGKPGKDSFFEAYVKEVIGELRVFDSLPSELTLYRLPVDIKFVAVHHFVELTYNGILRRLLVSFARAAVTDAKNLPRSSPNQVFIVSRSTNITFKPPIAPLPTKRTPASSALTPSPSSGAGKDGELPGYEAIGGMKDQIEQIRELVEWPLTRPELYNHFGALVCLLRLELS